MILALLSSLVLILAHLLPWLTGRSRPIEQSSEKIVLGLSGITTIPYTLLLALDVTQPAYNIVLTTDLNSAITRFNLLYSIGLVLFFLGCKAISIKKIKTKGLDEVRWPSAKQLTNASLILLLLLISFQILKVLHIGGLSLYIENISQRAVISAGTGIYDVVILPAAFLSIFTIIFCYGKYSKPSIYFVILFIAVAFFSFAIFGGRKLPLYIALFSLAAYSTYVRPVRMLSIKFFLTAITIAVFFAAALQYRGSSDYSEKAALEILISSIQNSSYVDTYLFVLDNFSKQDLWLGRSFGDLFIRFSPLGDGSLRPPIDEGTYIRSIYEGISISPPTSYEHHYQSSWPPESFGNGYANFGAAGIMLFFLAKGLITQLTLRNAVSNGFSPSSYFLFLFTAFNFHLTNLRIVQMLTVLVGVVVVYQIQKLARVRTGGK